MNIHIRIIGFFAVMLLLPFCSKVTSSQPGTETDPVEKEDNVNIDDKATADDEATVSDEEVDNIKSSEDENTLAPSDKVNKSTDDNHESEESVDDESESTVSQESEEESDDESTVDDPDSEESTDESSDGADSQEIDTESDQSESSDTSVPNDTEEPWPSDTVEDTGKEKLVEDPNAPEKHRATAPLCESIDDVINVEDENYEGGNCTSAWNCTEHENGRCAGNTGGYYHCVYDECFDDDDCNTGLVCNCRHEDGNQCLRRGNCRVDADCGDKGYCSPTLGSCGQYMGLEAWDGYYCHTPDDECIDDADCASFGDRFYCAYNETTGHWSCSDSFCVG